MTLLLDAPPWTPPAPGTALSSPHSAAPVTWRVYTRDGQWQPWDQAVTESIAAFTDKHGPPAVATMSAAPHLADALIARALTAAGLSLVRGDVTVQPGTWGLA